jgi:hypothetical protein
MFPTLRIGSSAPACGKRSADIRPHFQLAKVWKQAFDDPTHPTNDHFQRSLKIGYEAMFRIVTVVAAWLSLAFIAYATLSPLNERPEISGLFSHFDHYFGYAVTGGLFALAYPRQTLLVCLIVFGSAILLELAQLLTPDRHARGAKPEPG